MSKHQELLKDFGYVAQSARTLDALMESIVQRLHDTMTRYNWVGFYLVDKTRPGSLKLGPHVGSFDPHESVSLDKGLCGAAATSKKTVVVNNVANDPRYLRGFWAGEVGDGGADLYPRRALRRDRHQQLFCRYL